MSFLRPQALATLLRWREALIGAAIMTLSLWGNITAFGPLRWLSWFGLLAGAAIIWEGWRRARFPAGADGPGVVELDEGRLTYFGPQGGGAVDLADLVRIDILTTKEGPGAQDLFWIFHQHNGAPLILPGDAEGVEIIFDALASLSGVDYAAVTRAAGSTDLAEFTIWRSPQPALH